MPDRIEREINEILAKLEDLPDDGRSERRPVSIADHRDRHRSQPRQATPAKAAGPSLLSRIQPSTLLVSGAVTVIAGLLLSSAWGPLIWLSLLGLVLFLSGFALSFRQSRPRVSAPPGAVFWRDRYIEYTPRDQTLWSRIRRRFHR
jgi:hypothetical protein